MKIRGGFVSNSSSSSFIISNRHFPTVRKLAKYMINKQIKESQYEASDWTKEYVNINKSYLKRLNNIDENDPISFPSCNYDTYIRKVGDIYLVSTCNNTDWELYDYTTRLSLSDREKLSNFRDSLSDSDDIDQIDQILEDENYDEFYAVGRDFYDLRKEIIGVETYDYCPNTKNHSEYTKMWNTLKYGKICLICNPITKRKEKLDIINQLSKDEN